MAIKVIILKTSSTIRNNRKENIVILRIYMLLQLYAPRPTYLMITCLLGWTPCRPSLHAPPPTRTPLPHPILKPSVMSQQFLFQHILNVQLRNLKSCPYFYEVTTSFKLLNFLFDHEIQRNGVIRCLCGFVCVTRN